MRKYLSYAVLAVSLAACQTTGSNFKPISAKMSCGEIEQEMNAMSAIVQEATGAAAGHTIASTGAGVATNAALYSGAGASIPYFGGIANAATGLTSMNSQSKQADAKTAQSRYDRLQGMFDGKECAKKS